MPPLVECIPNFSEGRRADVVQAILDSVSRAQGVQLLDHHSDEDHNRSVVTLVGPPQAVAQAAFAGIQTAAELIDLDQHEGQHPRLGATDVVPFVPIREMTLDDCVTLARELGQRVGDELGIPVYLYEAAATRPDRVNLEDVRRGEYEALKESIASDPDRAPDYGPRKLGRAGATIIGARAPLIAYNVYLTTDDVGIAKQIAKAVRHSSGGLRYVKSIGLLVEGRAQVSMNLTDTTRTPIARVVELIRREAERYGVGVHHSELVGLTPQAALIDAARWYLQLDEFESDQILESRLFEAQDAEAEESFLDRLAAGTPTPGGGSAAAHAGALAAALAAMVARLTIGKKKYAEVDARMQEIAAQADADRHWFQVAAERDSRAFDGVMEAFRLPKATEAEQEARAAAIERATHQAAGVPLEVAKRAAVLLELAAEVAESANQTAISDAGTAAALAGACLHGASLNVRINAQSASDRQAADSWLDALREAEARGRAAHDRVHQALVERAELAREA